MTPAELLAELVDLFEAAIDNSIDIDWRVKDGAHACAAALLSDHEVLAALKQVAP